jgi:catechol 2,3-dioxygenase-like lactoylglutathione lyase family enzyme
MSESIRSLTGSARAPKIDAACCASPSLNWLSLRGLQQLTVESSAMEMVFDRAMLLILTLTVINVTATLYIDNNQCKGAAVSRIQLALNVSDLDKAIEFYSKFFKSEPAKVRAGYANFAIEEPPLKLVLIANEGTPGSINHLGVEVFTTEEVTEATKYLTEVGMKTRVEEDATCCFAVQSKVWVNGVDRMPWEIYTVLGDSQTPNDIEGDGTCCTTVRVNTETVTANACC